MSEHSCVELCNPNSSATQIHANRQAPYHRLWCVVLKVCVAYAICHAKSPYWSRRVINMLNISTGYAMPCAKLFTRRLRLRKRMLLVGEAKGARPCSAACQGLQTRDSDERVRDGPQPPRARATMRCIFDGRARTEAARRAASSSVWLPRRATTRIQQPVNKCHPLPVRARVSACQRVYRRYIRTPAERSRFRPTRA